MLALIISEKLTFEICYLQNVGQSHRVQFLQLHNFDGKCQYLQRLLHTFVIALNISKILTFKNFNFKSRSRSQSTILANYTIQWQMSESSKDSHIFALALTVLEK